MPSPHAVKEYSPNTFYHVFNRGVNKREIFKEKDDYLLFLHLIERYISSTVFFKPNGMAYPKFNNDINIHAYCLMKNHFHLLIETKTYPRQLAKFMLAHQAAYVSIFNQKYKRVGHLFQGRYKAKPLVDFLHKELITNYIHMNPGENFEKYEFSSFQYYEQPQNKPEWLRISGLS